MQTTVCHAHRHNRESRIGLVMHSLESVAPTSRSVLQLDLVFHITNRLMGYWWRRSRGISSSGSLSSETNLGVSSGRQARRHPRWPFRLSFRSELVMSMPSGKGYGDFRTSFRPLSRVSFVILALIFSSCAHRLRYCSADNAIFERLIREQGRTGQISLSPQDTTFILDKYGPHWMEGDGLCVAILPFVMELFTLRRYGSFIFDAP